MTIASVVGLVFICFFWVKAILPPKRDVPTKRDFILPPMHGGYKPRPGPTPRSYPPKPPSGSGGGSPTSKE